MLKIRFGTMILVNAAMSICVAMLVVAAMGELVSVYKYWQLLRASLVAMFISVVLLFSLRCYAGTLKMPYAEAVSGMHRLIRDRNLVYSEDRGTFIVRLGPYASARIRLEAHGEAVDVFFAPHGTPRGRSLVVLLAILAYTLPVAVAISIRFALLSRQFASDMLAHVSSNGQVAVGVSVRETTKDMLETSLIEARRIALETYEARRSDYHDYVALLAMGCVLSAVVGLILLLAYHISPTMEEAGPWLLALAAAGSVAFVSGLWTLKKRMRPEVNHLESWVKKLEQRLVIESMSTPLDDDSETSFEVLAAVGKELPAWFSNRARSWYYFHPWTGVLVMLLGFLAFSIAMSGVAVQPFGGVNGVAFLVAAVVAACAALVHRRAKALAAAERARFCDGWRQRWDAMMSDSDGLLGGR